MRTNVPLITLFFLLILASTAWSADAGISFEPPCEYADVCFQMAVQTNGAANDAENPKDRARLKMERLRRILQEHPGSVWAKRAGLLIGIMLTEPDSAEAVRFLKAAQRDLPIIDDYIRFWIAEALLKQGDVSQAAALFESVSEAVPDTLLLVRTLYRIGESWARADQCRKAVEPLSRAISLGPQEPTAPAALLTLAECQAKENRVEESKAALRQLWVRYPHSPEAKTAATRLGGSGKEGNGWRPTPDELYERAVSFSTLALHAEAVEEFRKFLVMAPSHPRRDEARFKQGVSFVRLKQYEQARDAFLSLSAGQGKEASEATVWLARIYLRLGDGVRLLALQTAPKSGLSAEQKAAILMLSGIWLEDQGRSDEALAKYRQVVQMGNASGQRSEALWRIGWVHYRNADYRSALETFQAILSGKEDGLLPQVLYWTARTQDRLHDSASAATYAQLCRDYLYTYYCQSARLNGALPAEASSESGGVDSVGLQASDPRPELMRNRRYLRALELRWIGMEYDAARELAALVDRYAGDRPALLELAALLNDVGAYHQALRLARAYFRDSLEGNGTAVPQVLWKAAYPTGYLSLIRLHAGMSVDPFLAAAIIREESQYDARALSRVGAIGLMQVMPATAQSLARKLGGPAIVREALFDQETNIRMGVRYLEQLLQQFSGNLIYAVAAYNAGPPIVATWITKYGSKDPDEFVELIPYVETRQYVKRVLRSYREYFRLSGASCAARSLDKVC
jgi:soluble lytic murein transglycosylase